jgi:hypothetical protein
MEDRRFSLEEFKALFSGRFESEDQLRREYRSFQAVFEHLDSITGPELSRVQKDEIFRRSWRHGRPDRLRVWPVVFRRPLVAFAAGIVLGCTLMFAVMHARAGRSQTPMVDQRVSTVARSTAADRMLTIEQTRYTQIYKGKIVERLYPQIENPRIVVEKAEESSPPQRVLYGTLDDGKVDVVWNL